MIPINNRHASGDGIRIAALGGSNGQPTGIPDRRIEVGVLQRQRTPPRCPEAP